jgi:beta-galactosidase
VGKRIHRAVAEHIKKFDYTRPITAAEDRTPEKSTIYNYCDIVGINYNLNIYDTVHEMCPDKPLFASECCATGTTRDWNFETDIQGRIRDKDVDTNSWFLGREKTYKFLRARDYVFGAFQWIAVEHRGEAAWPRICSVSGALDLFLQKKGAFYQNKSHWTKEPMVHIVPHWNFKGLEGEEVLVTVYTNCDELELFLNGDSLGRKQIEKYGHGEWNVPYEAGELKVFGYRNGKIVAEDKRTTTGKAVSLRLTSVNEFEANGRDLALFTCECLDENGNVVPDASEYVKFSVNAPAKIIGTGSDNCDHNNVANNERQMFMG